MIIVGLLAVIAGILTFAVGLFPSLPDIGSASNGIVSTIGSVMGYAASLGVWLPFGDAGAALLIIVSVFLVALVIHFVRMIISLFTGGGGSAS